MSDHTSISSLTPTVSPAAAKDVMPVPEQVQNKQAIQLLHEIDIQFKLSVGAADDPLEKEADDMAGKVMRMPVPGENERYRLWQAAFPEKIKLQDTINIRHLSSKFKLKGATIMNIGRYSSLMALSRRHDEIKFIDVEQGIKKEFMKEGKWV